MTERMIKPTDLIPNARLSEIVTKGIAVQDRTSGLVDDEKVAMANELLSARQALKIHEQDPMDRCAAALERIAGALEGATSIADAAEVQAAQEPENATSLPMQPIEMIDDIVRFRPNAIVKRLSDENWINLNTIAKWDVPVEDREQFWQQLGYSVSGYGDLPFARPETIAKADAIADKLIAGEKS